MRNLRSILSILAGMIVLAVGFYFLDRVMQKLFPGAAAAGDTPNFNMIVSTLAYNFVFATLATCVAGCLAPRKRMLHACIVGILCLFWSAGFIITHWDASLAWFHLVSLLVVMPAAWLGGFVARRISPSRRSHGRSGR